MNDATKKMVLTRIRRIAGQLEGVARMVENGRCCPDILLQIASAKAGLSQANRILLGALLESGIGHEISILVSEARQQQIEALIELLVPTSGLARSPL